MNPQEMHEEIVNERPTPIPVIATPRDTTRRRTYEGELNISSARIPEPLTIVMPLPPVGLYRYTITFAPLDDST